jgi:hypothetical protein
LHDELVSNYFGLFYFTYSNTKEAPRFRIVFELEYPILDSDYYQEMMKAFIWKFGANVDQNCSDPCRLFYGHKNSKPQYTDKILAHVRCGWSTERTQRIPWSKKEKLKKPPTRNAEKS